MIIARLLSRRIHIHPRPQHYCLRSIHAAMSLKREAIDGAPESDADPIPSSTSTTTTSSNKKPKPSANNASITSFFGAPKSSPSNAGDKSTTIASSPPVRTPQPSLSTNSSTWDKEAWLATLTPETRTLLSLEIHTLHETWLRVLAADLTSPSFIALKRFLAQEASTGHTIFPPSADVYSWSRHTPLPDVKVVILGQDPYHNHGQAHGLCFSVRPPTKAPPSLKNIYTALGKEYPTFAPPPANGGLLTPWADRGVLLLNTCLTVRAHAANSHANKGWEKLTQRVIELVAARRTRGVVFMAWGRPAQDRCAKIDSKRHLVLKSVHPSPLSAHRGFFDCGHFRRANEWLRERYGDEGVIDWDLNVKPEDAGV